MFEKLFDYLIDRFGVGITIFFGVPILLAAASGVIFGYIAAVIQIVAFAEQLGGYLGKVVAIFWLMWIPVFFVFWQIHKGNE